MNFNNAIEILELQSHNKKNITNDIIKKQYHKLALLYHPDKCKNQNNTRFIEIKKAYEYLTQSQIIASTEDHYSGFIKSIFGSTDTQDIITDIINKSNIITMSLFEKLDKNTLFIIYRFLFEYKNLFHLTNSILDQIKEIILHKYENEHIYIIYPTIDDLLDIKIYKLYVEEKLFLVPLWNKENYYEYGDTEDMVVYCIPELDENIRIDDKNDIHVDIHCSVFSLLTNPLITISLGKKDYFISADNLYIRPFQTYIITEQGLPKYELDENDTQEYSLGKSEECIKKGNIIVSIYLE